ncbi:PEGA domain-containing protein [Hahella ganghwensis]|uniref:PEGA domain-containing protein n=1 Tax=Hahella ganghwensis TaxID=286420 RepID=UPI00036560E3|nr:PEGA domain-containing protein [Hahella ganghwensis]
MVDLRPLLFVNALAAMLFATAGLAVHQRDFGDIAQAASQPETVVSTAAEKTWAEKIPSDIAAPDTQSSKDRFKEEVKQFRPTEDIPGESVEDAVLFVDQLTPEQQQERVQQEVSQEKSTQMLASLDTNPPPSTAQQAAAQASTTPAPVIEPKPALPKTGFLYIHSNVVKDKVVINGKSYGSSAVNAELPAGEYEVIVSKEGYKTWRSTIDVARGDRRSLSVTLDRITVVQYVDGVWKQGVVTGQGSYTGSDGTVYHGDFENKLFHGRGELKLADGTEYSGDWYEGRRHGEGTLSKPNGDSYTGEFRNDGFNGEGTLTLANGDIYTGYWVDGKLNGQGTFTAKDGTLYVGGFSENQYHGNGSLTLSDGTHYEGGFANGEFQGKGDLVYADGKKYSGQFFEGKFHGQGELKNPNGSSISGTFKFGKPFGMATLTTPEGEIFTARSSEPGVCYRLKSYRATQCPPMEGW